MSIRPIDLQNLFGRLNEVSKQQSSINEASHHAQAVAGSEIAEKSANKEKKVGSTETLQDGPEKTRKIGEDEKNPTAGNHPGEKKSKDEEKDETQEQDSIFRDPDLGNRIDIST